jgi:VWFA-related protein
MKRTGIAGVVVALAALAGTPPAVATQGELAGAFSEVYDVQVVNLEVVVTDRRGNRIDGLGREDFRLFVDGEEVAIEFFSEIAGGVATAGSGDTAAVPGASPGEAVGTSYLVFVDDFFSIANDRNRVLRGLSAQLGLLGPRDRMAVVAWDGGHLSMLSSWSSDQSELEKAFAQAIERPADGLQRMVERRNYESNEELVLRSGIDWRRAFDATDLAAEHYVALIEEQVQRATAAATSTLRAFASPPGRKVMLVLSGGWPAQPAAWAIANPSFSDRFARGDELIATLVHTANLLGYTLYPVDVPGLGRDSAIAAEYAQPQSSLAFFQREQEVHYTLERLARPTGGQALINSRNVGALEAVTTDTRAYYWLGFTADRQFDGRRHEVRVKVERPGLRLRHREGFEDFSRQSEVTMAVESALLFGNGAPQRALPLQLGAARRAGVGKVEVPLELAIPVDQVTFLRVGEGWTTQLELRVGVLDAYGGTAEVPVVPVSITLPEKPEPGTFLPYSTSMKLRRQSHDMVVSLYDPATGNMLTSNLEVDLR